MKQVSVRAFLSLLSISIVNVCFLFIVMGYGYYSGVRDNYGGFEQEVSFHISGVWNAATPQDKPAIFDCKSSTNILNVDEHFQKITRYQKAV